MADPAELTVGDVHLLLARCFDAPENPRLIYRLEFMHGEIPVAVSLGGLFHDLKVVRIIESDFDFVICVEDRVHPASTLSSNRILKHSAKRVIYQ
ncbi:MAG: hypothetical protein IT423_00540 [Pirellulaceae bacterium]|nr:hypothetical protein [Pirellulaceae bacterium]